MADNIPWFPEEVLPNSMSINLRSNSKMFESPFNRSASSHRFPGEQWVMTLNYSTLDNFTKPEIDILQSFIWSLQGVNGRFYARDYTKRNVRAKGNPVVQGDDQYGSVLTTSGWTPNQLVIPRGHYFSVNDELKYATKDIWSGSTGVAVMEFTPWLRNSPASGTPINVSNARGVFRLADNDQGTFELTPGIEGTLTLNLVEAFSV